MDVERWNRLHPEADQKTSHVHHCLAEREGPVVAATDYVRMYAEQIRPFIDKRYVTLGTDGYGRSDTRAKLRRFFEVDRYHVATAALKALADDQKVAAARVSEAIKKYDINPEVPNPITV